MLENPSTVQLDHRILATTTLIGTLAMHLLAIKNKRINKSLPPLTKSMLKLTTSFSLLQVSLGISTLLYLVPTPLAASHQAGSVALLSSYVALVSSLRRPGLAARLNQQFKRNMLKN